MFEVENAEATLAAMLRVAGIEPDSPGLADVWPVLKAFCLEPAAPLRGYPAEESFSWEFALDAPVQDGPTEFMATLLRSMAFNGAKHVEECFCGLHFPYDPELASFDEPELVEGYRGGDLLAFFAASVHSAGFRAALGRRPSHLELHQAAL